jgi:2-keto-4-pentenoate hydratase/2-oxohepta-3-ene-1,7-dioic acid hydratase in catechol pathway
MKLVTFEIPTPLGRVRRLGALLDNDQEGRVVDLTLAYTAYLREATDEPTPEGLAQLRTPPDMIGWLRGGHKSFEAAQHALAHVRGKGTALECGPGGEQIVHARSAVRLLSPLPRPTTFRDFSIYEDHGSRRDGDEPEVRRYKPENWYKWPPYYKGSPESVYGPEDPIPYPYYTKKLDLEPELGIVVGRAGRNMSEAEARAAIAGYTIVVDCSSRDGQKRDTLGPAKSKDFATMVGPCLVTPDEIDEANLNVRVLVDGDVWFEGNTNLPRSVLTHQLVAYASDNETLQPGELLGTGTIGTGCSIDLRKWVKVGQTVSIEFEGIGRMQHTIVEGEHVVDYVGSGIGRLLTPKVPANA